MNNSNNKKISAYITTRNCMDMQYPIVDCVKSIVDVMDEVVILDTTDKDDTLNLLQDLMEEHENVNVFHVDLDYSIKNWGVYDGYTKALARQQCTSELCFQIDSDEMFRGTRQQLNNLSVFLTEKNPIITLPVVEPWSNKGKIRMDIFPFKERLSLNLPHITHGIPLEHRKYVDGLLYSKGSDGCTMIHKDTLNPIPVVHCDYSSEIDTVRKMGLTREPYRTHYEKWYQDYINHYPYIYHTSWEDIGLKIDRYKKTWNESWKSIYCDFDKPKSWNPFFKNKSLEEVTEEDIKTVVMQLEETGGFIFHNQFDPNTAPKTNHICLKL